MKKTLILISIALLSIAALCGCGGGAYDAPKGVSITGTVSAPQAVALGRSSSRSASASGLVAKSFVNVEAYRIDDNGAKTGNTLTVATSSGSGAFTITLPAGVSASSNLVLSVGSGQNIIRSIVTSTSVNVNPVTELVVTTVVASAQPLSGFSLDEIQLIQTQVESDTANTDLSAATTVSAALTTMYTGNTKTNLDAAVTTAGAGEYTGGAVVATCGNGAINGTEECDSGANNTDTACTADYGKSCSYCDTSCHTQVVGGGACGDGTVNGTEECDSGTNNTDTACAADYGSSCNYCDTSCHTHTVNGA